MSAAPRIRPRDVLIFVAVSNAHYPLFELLRVQISYGLLPIQLALVGTAVLLGGRGWATFGTVLYAALAGVYFFALSVLGVGYSPFGAYNTTMQTATALLFIEYLLALGADGARSVILRFQRLFMLYVPLFAVLVLGIRAINDQVLFNQVAQSNYTGLLTTWLLIALLREPRVPRTSRAVIGVALLVNTLGSQRSSLVLNAITLVRRWLGSRRLVVSVAAAAALSLAVLLRGDRIAGALAPLWASAAGYWALVPLGFANLEEIIRYAVVTPESGLDASFMLRAISMVYIGRRVIEEPFMPVDSGGEAYLAVSHNLVLEYFKVGGLLFFLLSAVMLWRRYRLLFRRGYFAVDVFGVLVAALYSLLFNDLFLGFLLFPLALRSDIPAPSASSDALRMTGATAAVHG